MACQQGRVFRRIRFALKEKGRLKYFRRPLIWLDSGLETLRQHGIGNFDEAGNVRTIDVVHFVADFAVF